MIHNMEIVPVISRNAMEYNIIARYGGGRDVEELLTNRKASMKIKCYWLENF